MMQKSYEIIAKHNCVGITFGNPSWFSLTHRRGTLTPMLCIDIKSRTMVYLQEGDDMGVGSTLHKCNISYKNKLLVPEEKFWKISANLRNKNVHTAPGSHKTFLNTPRRHWSPRADRIKTALGIPLFVIGYRGHGSNVFILPCDLSIVKFFFLFSAVFRFEFDRRLVSPFSLVFRVLVRLVTR